MINQQSTSFLQCSHCHRLLLLSAFHKEKRNTNRNGYSDWCKECRDKEYRIWLGKHPAYRWAISVRSGLLKRAKGGIKYDKKGLSPKILTKMRESISTCPCCGIQLRDLEEGKTYKDGGDETSATLDKLNPKLGYVLGNVFIICKRCNRIKSNGTPQDHFRIAQWMIDNGYVESEE